MHVCKRQENSAGARSKERVELKRKKDGEQEEEGGKSRNDLFHFRSNHLACSLLNCSVFSKGLLVCECALMLMLFNRRKTF